MSCEFEDDLTALVDGELPSLRAKQLEAHLPGCGGCAATLGQVRAAVARLAELSGEERAAAGAAPGLRHAVLLRLDEPAGLGERLRAFWQPSLYMPALGMATATALLVVVLGQRPPDLSLESTEQALFAQNGDELTDFDVLGLDDADDVEVVEHLHELEVTP
ncbi:MAG: anti-sigma factor family protein [Myxococcaceae bacterium]